MIFDEIDGCLLWLIIILTLVSLITGWTWLVIIIGALCLAGIARGIEYESRNS